MAYQQLPVELIRDGQGTPWGFRLTGGADIGAHLVIQKVSLGSPSEGELRKGDIILRVRDSDSKLLSHQAATDLIIKSGSTLKLVIARCTGPVPLSGVSSHGTQNTMYHQNSGRTSTPPLRALLTPTPPDGNQYLFKPLPTTNFQQTQHRKMSTESYASTTSSDTEKDAIVNQPYRSTPLITPSIKSTKDSAIGSYLRHEQSFNTSTPPNPAPKLNDAFMLTKVQEAILEAAHHSPGRTPTPDMGYPNGPQVYLRQYNTPIHMYSDQAIVDALVSQSTDARKPQVNDVGVKNPNKTPLNITTSPTYQMIHEDEWTNLNKGKMREHKPREERVYNVVPFDECSSEYRSYSEIQQSGSFKSIKNNLQLAEFQANYTDY